MGVCEIATTLYWLNTCSPSCLEPHYSSFLKLAYSIHTRFNKHTYFYVLLIIFILNEHKLGTELPDWMMVGWEWGIYRHVIEKDNKVYTIKHVVFSTIKTYNYYGGCMLKSILLLWLHIIYISCFCYRDVDDRLLKLISNYALVIYKKTVCGIA